MLKNSKKSKLTKYIQIIIVIFIILSGSGYYLFRYKVNANLQVVVPGKVYRSAQPFDVLLEKWIKKYDFKTVINLRAKKLKDFEHEKKFSESSGIKFIPIDLSAYRLISSEELKNIIEILNTAETPILLHCKSGIDRSGFVSMLTAMAIGHLNYDIAKSQAYVPPGPWKRKDFSKTRADYIHNYAHISDILKLYEDYCLKKNVNKNDWQTFVEWAVELPPIKDLNMDYKTVYSYFPFINKGTHFFPIYKLLKDTYLQFSLQILVVVLLILHTKNCLKSFVSSKRSHP
jgi:protein tyrosine phosphatase (PTP) superfamily phosphohydrolase (DUF442 family)